MIEKGNFITIKQAMELLPIGRTSLYKRGKEHPELMVRFGGKVFVNVEELEKLLTGSGRRATETE